jgi:hypothetical protein
MIFIDHKNNTLDVLKISDCGLHWILPLEEYGGTFE